MYFNEKTTERGKRCENHVIDGLLSKGFTLLDRNYSIHNIGELDIVMQFKQYIYFIEVKARKKFEEFPSPIEAITNSKRVKIYKTAQIYLKNKGLNDIKIGFLAACVNLNRDGSIQNVEIIPF